MGRLLRGEIIIATDGDNITSCSNNTTATRESDRANNVGPRAKWKETTGSDQYKCLSTFQYESELWSLLACCYPPPNGHLPHHPSPLEFINFDIKTIGSRFCDFPPPRPLRFCTFLCRSITVYKQALHWWRRKLWHTQKCSMSNLSNSPPQSSTALWCDALLVASSACRARLCLGLSVKTNLVLGILTVLFKNTIYISFGQIRGPKIDICQLSAWTLWTGTRWLDILFQVSKLTNRACWRERSYF